MADLAAGNRLKGQLSLKSIPAHRVFEQSQSQSETDNPAAVAQAPPTQKEINEDWYSSGSERERKQPTPPNEREPTTPIYSDEDENDESKSESFGDVSSEGLLPSTEETKAHTTKKKKSHQRNNLQSQKTPNKHQIQKRKEERKFTVDAVVEGDETTLFFWKQKLQTKEVGPKKTARKRCHQCLADGRPESKTSYVCVQFNYTYPCKPGNCKNNYDCFRRWHVKRQQNLLQHKKTAILPVASL